jgi:predicted DNA-binding transcriptional regulator AlpA
MKRDKEKGVELYLSMGELMDMLAISRSTVYRLMLKGMPNIVVGAVHRFPKDQALTWLKARGDKAGNEKIQPATRN